MIGPVAGAVKENSLCACGAFFDIVDCALESFSSGGAGCDEKDNNIGGFSPLFIVFYCDGARTTVREISC